MRNYTISYLLKMPLAKPSDKQAPFPGKYPTRVAIFVKNQPPYIGKPFGTGCYFTMWAFHPTRVLEFDRAHVLLDTDLGKAQGKITRIATRLARLYHPGLSVFHYLSKPEVGLVGWFDRLTKRNMRYVGFEPSPDYPHAQKEQVVSYL